MASTAPRNTQSSLPAYPLPALRRLRIYAFDPHASIELDTAVINDATVELPWETPWEDKLEIGPVNEYLEVIDYDPACGLFYAPVDLNDPHLLAQNGLAPSEGRPQFHQQMVFAVAMKTIRIFERALGRPVMWVKRPTDAPSSDEQKPRDYGKEPDRHFVKRLRIYPHALREPNAYYSPEKTALLFGYFRKSASWQNPDDGWVFTCLSQDIIAHETTHAILHGMQTRSIESSNLDSLAFHEAFADIVALFQHFTMRNVVEHQLRLSKGSMRDPGLLTGLASQFGKATGREGALRYALEMLTIESAVKLREAEGGEAAEPPPIYSETAEPHKRGQFLVAAVFDAFATIYEKRTEDLRRMASKGPDLSNDLVGRLAAEARKAADHVLRMCVRALDYVPPVDVLFGEFLRGIITADADLVPDDPMRYRVAISEAFRKRGIFVAGAISMAPDSLVWDEADQRHLRDLEGDPHMIDDPTYGLFADAMSKLELAVNFARTDAKGGRTGYEKSGRFNRRNLREESMRIILANQKAIWQWLTGEPHDRDHLWEHLLGVKLNHCEVRGIPISPTTKKPAVEVHLARIAKRQGPDGQDLQHLIVQVTQRRRAYFDEAVQEKVDSGELTGDEVPKQDFWFRGGATLHIDLRDGRLRRVIRKKIDNPVRLKAERDFRSGESDGLLHPRPATEELREPFAFIHRGPE